MCEAGRDSGLERQVEEEDDLLDIVLGHVARPPHDGLQRSHQRHLQPLQRWRPGHFADPGRLFGPRHHLRAGPPVPLHVDGPVQAIPGGQQTPAAHLETVENISQRSTSQLCTAKHSTIQF